MATVTLTPKNVLIGHAYGPYAAYAAMSDTQKAQFIHFNMDDSGDYAGTISFKGVLFGQAKYPTAVTNVGDGTIKLTMTGRDDIVSGSLKASSTAYGMVKTTNSISGANTDASLVPTYSVVFALETNKAPKASPIFTGTPKAPTPTSDNETTQIATVGYVLNKMAANDAMRYCGTLGTGGDVTSLPTITDTSVKHGDSYKIVTAGTYNSQNCKVGDMFIANKPTSTSGKWDYVPSGNENETSIKYTSTPSAVTITTTAKYGTVVLGDAAKYTVLPSDAPAADSDDFLPTAKRVQDKIDAVKLSIDGKVKSVTSQTLSASTAQGNVTIELKSIITAASIGGMTANAAPGFGGTATIYGVSVDAYGRVTARGTGYTIKIPNSVASSSANGLMSNTDKSNLDALVAGCCWYETSVS